jgi:hypothetical protein
MNSKGTCQWVWMWQHNKFNNWMRKYKRKTIKIETKEKT